MLRHFRFFLAPLLALATVSTMALIAPGLRPAAAPKPVTLNQVADTTPLPVVETDSFPTGSGDVADDPAIWVDAANPGNSVVIVDNKADSGGGLGVFDMNGKLIHFKQDGKMGNVDLREGFMLSGNPTVLVGTNNRSNNTIALYAYDTVARTLSSVHARNIFTVSRNYGFCMYHSPVSGKFYAFVTPYSGGDLQQFELFDNGAGQVDARLVRTLSVNSITEGCVADDGLANFYAAQEDVGIWKYGAEPGAGSTPVAVNNVGDGNLVADVEGLGIAYGPNGTGHLFASSQGDDTFLVYDRAGNNPFIKKFHVGANGSIDTTTHSDGLDVTTGNAGPGFESGLLVVHDEVNSGGSTSNHRYVPLSSVLG